MQFLEKSFKSNPATPQLQGDRPLGAIKGMNPRGKPRLVFRPKGRGMNPKRFKQDAAGEILLNIAIFAGPLNP
jgi:hypothetical protein